MSAYRIYRPLVGEPVLQAQTHVDGEWQNRAPASMIPEVFEPEPFKPFFQVVAGRTSLTPAKVAEVVSLLRGFDHASKAQAFAAAEFVDIPASL